VQTGQNLTTCVLTIETCVRKGHFSAEISDSKNYLTGTFRLGNEAKAVASKLRGLTCCRREMTHHQGQVLGGCNYIMPRMNELTDGRRKGKKGSKKILTTTW
jgi:hypothetical protein